MKIDDSKEMEREDVWWKKKFGRELWGKEFIEKIKKENECYVKNNNRIIMFGGIWWFTCLGFGMIAIVGSSLNNPTLMNIGITGMILLGVAGALTAVGMAVFMNVNVAKWDREIMGK